MTSKTLSVAAIKNGTVIDHIPHGRSLQILSLLNMTSHPKIVTVGVNLPSQSMGRKDIIKLEDREITPHEGSRIAIFAPEATIAIIHNYVVSEKIALKIPSDIQGVFPCQNQNCITNHDRMDSGFRVIHAGTAIRLECIYCERAYSQDDMKEFIQ
jgi:aspartate carbamoyltransferase regulatory subunit